ncbi:MAG: hypothetical protein ACRC8A_21480 [Microcoleaceae cyanobacterium]
MTSSTPAVPEKISFEQAIQLTQDLLDRLEAGTFSDAELEQAIASLVKTQNGARGFFVTYLPDSRPVVDHPSTALINGLKTSPDLVAELMVKNIAMSAAMVVYHQRNQDPESAQGSEQVRSRSVQLIQALSLPVIQTKVQQLSQSATTGTGDYADFLQRWGYDAEQKQAILAALKSIQ